MKKFLSIFLAMVLLIGGLPFESFADTTTGSPVGSPTDIRISKYYLRDTDGNNITGSIEGGPRGRNNRFDLVLELSNSSSATDIYVELTKSPSFTIVGEGSKKGITDSSNQVVFPLEYNGGKETRLDFTIYYKVATVSPSTSSDASVSDYINISNIRPYNPEDDKPVEPKPLPDAALSLVSNKTTSADPGETIDVPIELKNISNGYANNISVSTELVGDTPLMIRGTGQSDFRSLRPGRSESTTIRVEVDKRAEGGNYPIKVNYTFFNDNGNASTGSDTTYVKVNRKDSNAALMVTRVDINPKKEINPGEIVTVGFEIKNTGDTPLKDIKVSLDGLANGGFALANGLNLRKIPSMEQNNVKYVSFDLKASNQIKAGSHELTLNLDYKDIKNTEYKDQNKFFIPVTGNKNNISSLIIENVSSPQGAIGQNKEVTISFDVRNRGQLEAKNLTIKSESQDMQGLQPTSSSILKHNSLLPGEKQRFTFKFKSTKASETKNYLVNFTVDSFDEFSEEASTVNQYVGVFVDAPDKDGKKTTPKLIIDKYSFSPSMVEAGKNFEMKLSFYNTNSSKTVKNIKIFLTSEPNVTTGDNAKPTAGTSVFTPVDSSNTFYIDSIKPKGKVEKNITMFTIPDAAAKTHTITANFEYEDGSGEAYTATELIGIPVVQQSKLEVGELVYSPEAMVGDYAPVSVEFYNTGKTPLYNMMVKLEGNFQTESGNYYIGNFANGSSDSFEGNVIPNEAGEIKGAVVFTYEDSTGEQQEIRHEFAMNVSEMTMPDIDDEFPPMEEPGGIKKLLKNKIIWAVIILGAGGFGGFKFYKKKKAEKDLDLDE